MFVADLDSLVFHQTDEFVGVGLRGEFVDIVAGAAIREGLEHFRNCCRPKMNCHSERSEESPHFSRGTTVYTINENALERKLLLYNLAAYVLLYLFVIVLVHSCR